MINFVYAAPVALCAENKFYTEDQCIQKCVNGDKIDVKCCPDNSQIIFEVANQHDKYGGYNCAVISNKNNTDSGQYSLPYSEGVIGLIVGVAIVLGFIIFALILRKKK